MKKNNALNLKMIIILIFSMSLIALSNTLIKAVIASFFFLINILFALKFIKDNSLKVALNIYMLVLSFINVTSIFYLFESFSHSKYFEAVYKKIFAPFLEIFDVKIAFLIFLASAFLIFYMISVNKEVGRNGEK